MIFLTGNYTFFNLLTMALCLFLFDDHALENLRLRARNVRISKPAGDCGRGCSRSLERVRIAGDVFRHCARAAERCCARGRAVPDRQHVRRVRVNDHQPARDSVQGSNDGVTWLDYDFRYKPGDLRQAPRWVEPHQPRLDWQMWFAALGDYRSSPWFTNFMVRLLQGSPAVVGLLGQESLF